MNPIVTENPAVPMAVVRFVGNVPERLSAVCWENVWRPNVNRSVLTRHVETTVVEMFVALATRRCIARTFNVLTLQTACLPARGFSAEMMGVVVTAACALITGIVLTVHANFCVSLIALERNVGSMGVGVYAVHVSQEKSVHRTFNVNLKDASHHVVKKSVDPTDVEAYVESVWGIRSVSTGFASIP